MSASFPLVTCIMPTRNRHDFARRSIALFQAQDYPRKRLLIFEDGDARSVGQPPPTDVIYVRSPVYKSIGEKRNAMCTVSTGEIIAHWDDDDWHSPRRLSAQVEAMRAQGARLCGLDRLVFYNGERAWLFQTPRKPWLAGGTLMYERSLWQEQPFANMSDGEDTAFVDAAYKRGVKIAILTDESLYVATLHDSNTTKRDTSRLGGSYDADTVRRWME
jgi:glycosyltransferase involved in cell wall biosynthesis